MSDEASDFAPPAGVAERIAPGVRRILAPNPSPMTYRGTNTYLLGESEIAVIDPGPELGAHLQAILGALEPGQRITRIVVTHSHVDHSPLARPLAEETGAEIVAFGGPEAGRSPIMAQLARGGLIGGGEGIDRGFLPDRRLGHGDEIQGEGWTLRALHTPGHLGNHLSLISGNVAFTGDHVMGWATSLVSPPDGDLTDFMASLERLAGAVRAGSVETLLPGHGAPVARPLERIEELLRHRRMREGQILRALAEGPATAAGLAARIYTDVAPALLPAAERNVIAHLVDLHQKGRVLAEPELAIGARFSLPARQV